jgi:hypothetical protein
MLAPAQNELNTVPAKVMIRARLTGTVVMMKHILLRLMAVLALLGLVMAAHRLWACPYQLHLGATGTELKRAMPGDELDPNPGFLATRAITIDGTPEKIWPWLVQMGYGRAGYYGYDILENLGSDRGIHSADRILPEFQNFTVGDEVPISPVARMFFHSIEPNRYLIWSGKTGKSKHGSNYGGFIWALYPMDEGHTRLVSRIRWSFHWTLPGILALEVLTEFADHLAIRKILHGVKDRVEGRVEPVARQNTEFAMYLATALIFLAAVLLTLLRPLTWARWLAGLTAGLVWLLTWYAPVPIWTGALLELLVLWGLRQAFRRSLPAPHH